MAKINKKKYFNFQINQRVYNSRTLFLKEDYIVNEEGLLISETCYAKSVMAAINTETGDKPYVNFSFETFNGETVKFRWNADNTISNVTIISTEETLK